MFETTNQLNLQLGRSTGRLRALSLEAAARRGSVRIQQVCYLYHESARDIIDSPPRVVVCVDMTWMQTS